jgi:hypothetical protein
MTNLNSLFTEAVESLIKEARGSPEAVIDTEGALGQGRHTLGVGVGKSRAEVDPKGLMKDLGVSKQTSNSDLKNAATVITQAIQNNKTMSSAFDTPQNLKKPLIFSQKKRGKKPVYHEEKVDVIIVPIKGDILSYRNAVYFVALTLEGAYNSGLLELNGKIKFLPEQKGAKVPMFYAVSFND